MRCQGYRVYLLIASFFLVAGLSFVIVGVMIGMNMTTGVEKQLQDHFCIDSKDHPDYENWANPPPYQTLLYFWDVLNGDDMLYNRKIPKVAERGPYVYKTTAKKIDVEFDKKQGRVKYKEFIQQEFDKNATKQKCPNCNEHDEITVVNKKLFQMLHVLQWDTKVASFSLPSLLQRFLLEMDKKTGGRNATYARIGRFQPSLMPPTHPLYSFGFGTAIMENIALYPELQFAVMQKGRDYNETEMRGLYEAFIDPKLFSWTDVYSFYVCNTNFRFGKCGILAYMTHYARLSVIKQSTSDLPPEEAKTIDTDLKELYGLIKDILCQSKTQCYPFDAYSFTVLSFFFGITALPLSVHNTVEKSFVFTNRSQKELALGYTDPYYPQFPKYPDGVPVSGYLAHDVDENATRQRGETKSFYTCSAGKDKSFSWAGCRNIPGVFTSDSKSPLTPFEKLKSYDKQLPPTSKISLCKNDFSDNQNTLRLFLPDIFQVNDLYSAGMSNTPRPGNLVPTMRFNLDQTNLANVTFNKTILPDVARVKDVSSINGFTSVASLPYFVDSQRNFRRRHNISDPDIENCRCYVDLEPLTGQIVAAKIRSQVSAALTKFNIMQSFTYRTRKIDMGYTNPEWPGGFKYIPIYWTEKSWTVNQSEITQFYKTLETACQITVYLPTCGGVFILASVIMFVVILTKHRANSVAAAQPPPEPEM